MKGAGTDTISLIDFLKRNALLITPKPQTHANNGSYIFQIASDNVFRSHGQPKLLRQRHGWMVSWKNGWKNGMDGWRDGCLSE